MAFTVGIDIGGTFTDIVVINEATGEVRVTKTLSTLNNRADGMLDGLRKLEVPLAEVSRVVHGMTVATNAMLERNGAKVALITTRGFRDVLEIGRTQRMTFTMFDPYFVKPAPIVGRQLRFEVGERVLHDGSVERALDEEEVRGACRLAREAGAEAFAICFINSHRNARHEEHAARIVAEETGGRPISISSEVVPEYREFERFSTTAANAFVQPVISHYLASFDERLRAAGYEGPVYIMASSGGTMDAQRAARMPVTTLFSGPAGGVVGAIGATHRTAHRNIISYDMGGTSTDVCLIEDGAASFATQSIVAGMPIKVPQVNINTVGAGGGSIAWVDNGSLRVGPRSAGSTPGPVCYGRGGSEITVTDANLLLGRVGERSLLDGEIVLDMGAAQAAMDRLCEEVGMRDAHGLAEGVIRLAVVKMANAIREISLQRGHDPAEFALLALGGAGPMHAAEAAAELGIARVVIPRYPGNLSALGLVSSDLRLDYSTSFRVPLVAMQAERADSAFERMIERGRHELRESGHQEAISSTRLVDLRYSGQAFELTIALDPGPISAGALREAFVAEYVRQYGHKQDQGDIEVVALRVAVTARVPRPNMAPPRAAGTSARRTTREAQFQGVRAPVPVLRRESLDTGFAEDGPMIIEEFGATTVVPPSWRASLEPNGNILLTRI